MNRGTEHSRRVSRPPASRPSRGIAPALFGILGILVIGLLLANSLLGKKMPRPESGSEAAAPDPSGTPPTSVKSAAARVEQAPLPQASRASNLNSGRAPVTPVQPDTSAAQLLLAHLAHIQATDGKLSPEQAQQVKQELQQLVAQGAAALPAVRQFFEQNQDLNFGGEASKVAGVPSLRAGLLDALGQIGGTDALSLTRQILQSAISPLEIALAARNLEAGAPGQYTQESLDAARQALSQLGAGKLEAADPAPLFQVLQTYGDANAAADLEKLASNWKYYATMALAGLPNGLGIPSLVRLAEEPVSDPGQYNKLPVQMLAQLSAQYPEASSALLELARQNQIPDNAWRAIAAGLGGNQYQFSRQFPQNSFPEGGSIESGTSTVGGPNETYYSIPLSNQNADIPQRLALIDQLLASVSANPAAQGALNQARSRLTR